MPYDPKPQSTPQSVPRDWAEWTDRWTTAFGRPVSRETAEILRERTFGEQLHMSFEQFVQLDPVYFSKAALSILKANLTFPEYTYTSIPAANGKTFQMYQYEVNPAVNPGGEGWQEP